MKLHETSFLYALIRFVVVFILFYLIRRNSKKKTEYFFSEFVVINISKYASLSIVLVFFLTLLNAFNLFNFLWLVFVFLMFDLNNFNHPKIIYSYLKHSFDKYTTDYIGFIESSQKKQNIINSITPKKLSNSELYDLISVLIIITLVFLTRMFFYSNDLFLFSENWFTDYEKLTLVQNQKWFNIEYQEMGEYALISIFSYFFKVSPGMSLQMFGLLQTIILSILIFFIVKRISRKDKLLTPILTSFLFFAGLSILPIDLTSIFKHQKIFTIIFILLPVVVKTSEKQHYYKFRTNLFILCLAFVAITLTSFASMIILVTPMFIILVFFDNSKTISQQITLFLLPFTIGLLTLTFFMSFYEYGHFNIDFFLKNSFIEISNFTKTESLYFNYETIIKCVSILSTITIVINILNHKLNLISVTICTLYLFVAAFYHTELFLIDKNLLLSVFSFLTPLSIGCIISDLLFNNIKWFDSKNSAYISSFFIVLTFFIGGTFQKNFLKRFKKSNETNRQLLSVYDKIITSHLPYSYAVVNHEGAITFSTSNHFFINYHELNRTYAEKDSIFHNNRKKKSYLKAHPEAIIPNSVFLFEILGVDKNVSRIGFLTPEKQLKKNDSIIKVLKSRGRNVSLYVNTNRLRVYKIINKKNSSNVNKMLFYDKRL
ncbi:hypothetical protein SAMN04489761_1358 [Tenacibaculum sp. MAR_2009_124]|uniref:hypothetical protein n=1 Tax=Tenacibaculum sp. MAR_2009_124 TaxID=1250059 RepID=UPI00089918DC|nr:hypothetical protein [Tenacibaculum sp. MAR_2009_124]SEB65977.1 hypothetical protein SAMN04489761_1358 [Tenacibaculum sp. MAR_2009_124]